MHSLVAFATQWGSRYGGINSFNSDFLSAFAVAYQRDVNVICVVSSATDDQIENAQKSNVRLISLPYKPQSPYLMSEHGEAGVARIKQLGLGFQAESTIWLGHDRITGHAAISAARVSGGGAAVVCHMSYDHYETYAETSQSAVTKTADQRTLFRDADIVLAVGPLLRDAAKDLVNQTTPVHMLVPGLVEIDTQDAPTTFVAFLSARLTDDAARIKQGHLGIAAFATAQREAREDGRPDSLRNQPKLVLRGVDLEGLATPTDSESTAEFRLKQFAERYAGAVVNLHTLPFTEAKKELYNELARSSVCLMPSWHEGFGLAAWEAIAAGVPVILSRNSGVYKLLDEEYPAGPGCVYPIEIGGAFAEPFFTEDDLEITTKALKTVADDPRKARQRASMLRNMVGERTWPVCAGEAAKAFGWDIEKGTVSLTTSTEVRPHEIAPAPARVEVGPLLIPTGKWRSNAGMADSQLLRAEEALLDFDPRRLPDVNELREWMDDEKWPVAIRLVTGAGGQGKTRLALELCNQSVPARWRAGFLASSLEVTAITPAWHQLLESQKPLLMVIDYAETRQSAVLGFIKAALASPSNHPVRLLLLARDGGEWWDNLPSKDSECEALLSGYATTGPFSISPLYEAKDDRHDAYQRSLRAFATVLHVIAPTIEPDLTGDHFERPLYVQMAALLALYGEQPTTSQGLTRGLLNHERRYWSRLLAHFNWQEPERRAEQLLALSTLAGGFPTANAASTYWNLARPGVVSTADFNSLFRELVTLYPGTQGLEALRPDLLGEALVAQALLRPSGDGLLDSVLTSSATHAVRRNALTVLARLSTQRTDLQGILIGALSRHLAHSATDVVAVGRETRSRLPGLTELAFDELTPPAKSQVSGLLTPLLYEESVELAGLSCKVDEYLCEKSRERLEKKSRDVSRIAQYSQALDRYATSLNRVGRYDEACEKSLMSVEVWRQLVTRGLKQFESHYALALNNAGINLSEAGRHDEALQNDAEALDIRKRLAQKNPNRFEPDYAKSLSSYGVRLAGAGRYEEALQHAGGALKIHRQLAEKNPDQFEPDYAASLNNYAIDLSNAGRDKESLQHALEALEIRRRLAEKNPDRFEPEYAISLSNYGNSLSDAGRYEEALQHDGEALEIRRRLAQKNPDRFEPDFATSLNNYAVHLSEIREDETSLQRAVEALDIRKRLARKSAPRIADDLLNSIYLAQLLLWLGPKGKHAEPFALNHGKIDEMLALVLDHRRTLMGLYSDFVNGCEAVNVAVRKACFRRVLSHWCSLPTALRSYAEPYWLCAASWCAKFDVTDSDERRDVWRRYDARRHGRIPHWMTEVARRLDFGWPE